MAMYIFTAYVQLDAGDYYYHDFGFHIHGRKYCFHFIVIH